VVAVTATSGRWRPVGRLTAPAAAMSESVRPSAGGVPALRTLRGHFFLDIFFPMAESETVNRTVWTLDAFNQGQETNGVMEWLTSFIPGSFQILFTLPDSDFGSVPENCRYPHVLKKNRMYLLHLLEIDEII
jgi:hypothetical protein